MRDWWSSKWLCVVVVGSSLNRPWGARADEPEVGTEKTQQEVAIAGEYVRVVSNDEAVLVLGYRAANLSVGQEWMLIELAMATQVGHNATLTREAFTLILPDGREVPIATQEAFNRAGGKIRALDQRALIQRDSLNYLPVRARIPCRIGFFTDAATPGRGLAYDQVSLSPDRHCVGRLYFQIPDGIQYGRHFLRAALHETTLEAPFTIMSKEELKAFKKELKAAEKERKQRLKEEKKKQEES